MAMLPKGDEPLGNAECARAPGCLRPSSMKNTDVKLLAAAANRSPHAVAADTAPEQQGFVNGRQFLMNVAMVDAEARRLSMLPSAPVDMPVFASMDIAAAFPSLVHQWL